MAKHILFVCIRVFTLFFLVSLAYGQIALPVPSSLNDASLFQTLKKRSSTPGGDFSIDPIKDEHLADILWSATGLNRGEKGWTIPGVNGLPPYIQVYVARSDGTFLYDWQQHQLISISKDNIKARIGSQAFVKRVPQILIFVADLDKLPSFKKEQALEFAYIQTGAMTQNIYLTSSSLHLGARYIHSIKKDAILKALGLKESQIPIGLMLIGK